MKVYYDFHIHSALSPCADDDMTPSNIIGMAAVKGLHAVAISDHNSTKNVQAAMECGEDFGIIVIPAMEVQTSEDIHVLTLFYDYAALEAFHKSLTKRQVKNREQIFGNQLIIDAEDNVTGREEYLLLVGVEEGIYTVIRRVKSRGGIAVLAHVDREENGTIAILGQIPTDIGTDIIELSKRASPEAMSSLSGYKRLFNSDAHRLEDISDAVNYIEAPALTIKDILDSIKEAL
ncbi:MAG: PHP-associated domain-containing protein [Clostridia bacterium]|nr:PHP-associated domain-containing protein [Clostridia bacterium]